MSAPRDRTVYYRRARFTTHLPMDRRYSPAHYWLLEESPRIWRVGFTRFATRMLGDIVELSVGAAPGTELALGDEIGTVEGMKALTSLYAVGTGRFLEGSPALQRDITLIESDPYGAGWLYRFEGEPAPDVADVHGYVAILDSIVDRMLAERHDQEYGDADDR